MAKIESNFEYFVYIIFGPLVLFLGFFGNTMGIVVLKGKQLGKLGPMHLSTCTYDSHLHSC